MCAMFLYDQLLFAFSCYFCIIYVQSQKVNQFDKSIVENQSASLYNDSVSTNVQNYYQSQGDIPKDHIKIKMCCAENEIFDYTWRKCVPGRKSVEDLSRKLSSLYQVELVTGHFNCSQVTVDYNAILQPITIAQNKKKTVLLLRLKTGAVINLPKNENEFCIDQSSDFTVVLRKCFTKKFCETHICLSKCTSSDYSVGLKNDEISETFPAKRNFHETIMKSNVSFLKAARKSITKREDYGLSIGFDHCEKKYLVKKYWHMSPELYIFVKDHRKKYRPHRYCLDTIDESAANNSYNFPENIVTYVCIVLKDKSLTTVSAIRGLLTTTSCIFILMTMTIIIVVPSFNNLYGRCLFQHCLCYFLTFFCMTFTHFRLIPESNFCKYWGYLILFFHLGIFTWLNLLAFLIWNGIGKALRVKLAVDKLNDRSTFYKFCFYAWGIPSVIVITIIILNLTKPFDYYFLPVIDKQQCWFARIDNVGAFLYFTLPTSVFLFINIIFFTWTFINYNKVNIQVQSFLNKKSDMNQRNVYKKQFYINLKLLFVMGVPLIFDALSSSLWHIHDSAFDGGFGKFLTIMKVLNNLQGVVLFVILTFKRKVLNDFRKAWRSKPKEAWISLTETSHMNPSSSSR